ncbi:MAG: hypothetical protein VSS52_009880 [Thiotrichaceae bacterium]|nr:hypothetical protein [Thiotrichaceae bacterium]
MSDFILSLADDFNKYKDDWENQNLYDFLEAVSAWIKDIDGDYTTQEQIPNKWSLVADILLAAKTYE